MSGQEAVLESVRAERRRQDARWGVDHRPDDLTMLAVLMEETGEVARALVDRWPEKPDHRALVAELVQVAAVAVHWLEMLESEVGAVRKPSA